MKGYFRIYGMLFIIDSTIALLHNCIENKLLSLLTILSSLPLYVVNKSYPYYAEGSLLFGVCLLLINVLLQTILLQWIFKSKSSKTE